MRDSHELGERLEYFNSLVLGDDLDNASSVGPMIEMSIAADRVMELTLQSKDLSARAASMQPCCIYVMLSACLRYL